MKKLLWSVLLWLLLVSGGSVFGQEVQHPLLSNRVESSTAFQTTKTMKVHWNTIKNTTNDPHGRISDTTFYKVFPFFREHAWNTAAIHLVPDQDGRSWAELFSSPEGKISYCQKFFPATNAVVLKDALYASDWRCTAGLANCSYSTKKPLYSCKDEAMTLGYVSVRQGKVNMHSDIETLPIRAEKTESVSWIWSIDDSASDRRKKAMITRLIDTASKKDLVEESIHLDEELSFQVNDTSELRNLFISNDHYAVIRPNEDGTQYVYHDWKKTKSYHKILRVTVSDLGDLVFISQLENGNYILVYNGEESPEYKQVWQWDVTRFVGETFVYYAQKLNWKRIIIQDGEEISAEFNNIDKFSPELKYAIAQLDDEKYVVLKDRKVSSSSYVYIHYPIVDKESWDIVFVGEKENGNHIFVKNWQEIWEEYSYINARDKVCSKDCETVLMVASKDWWSVLLKDGIEVSDVYSHRHSDRAIWFLTISENGESFAFSTKKKDDSYAVIHDGVESVAYDYVMYIYLSPDWKDILYQIWNETKGKETTHSIVHNWIKQNEYEDIFIKKPYEGNMLYSYVWVKSGGEEVLIVNGEESDLYTRLWTVIFDEKRENHLRTATLKKNGKQVVLYNGVIHGNEYDSINQVWRISDDGKHISYAATVDNGKVVFVVDDKISDEYDYIGPNMIRVDKDSKLNNAFFWLNGDWKTELVINWVKTILPYSAVSKSIIHKDGTFSFVWEKENGKKVFVKNFKESKTYDEIDTYDSWQRPSNWLIGKNYFIWEDNKKREEIYFEIVK